MGNIMPPVGATGDKQEVIINGSRHKRTPSQADQWLKNIENQTSYNQYPPVNNNMYGHRQQNAFQINL